MKSLSRESGAGIACVCLFNHMLIGRHLHVGDVVPGVVVYLMIVPEKPLWGGNNKVCMYVYVCSLIPACKCGMKSQCHTSRKLALVRVFTCKHHLSKL